MSEQVRESLSALLDEEANELDLARVLKGLDQNEGAYNTWRRYHLLSAAAAGESDEFSNVDLHKSVRAALADESLAPRKGIAGRLGQALKPLASVAVAATVTVVVLGGAQVYQRMQGDVAVNDIAAADTPSGLVTQFGDGQVVSLGDVTFSQRQAEDRRSRQAQAAANQLAQRRLEAFLQSHSETASLNASSSLMPMARSVPPREGQ